MRSFLSLHWPVIQRVIIYKGGRCIVQHMDFSPPGIVIIDALDFPCCIRHPKVILEKVLPESSAQKSTPMKTENTG